MQGQHIRGTATPKQKSCTQSAAGQGVNETIKAREGYLLAS